MTRDLKTHPAIADLDAAVVAQGLQPSSPVLKVEEARKWILPQSFQKELSPADTFIWAHGDPCQTSDPQICKVTGSWRAHSLRAGRFATAAVGTPHRASTSPRLSHLLPELQGSRPAPGAQSSA